MTFRFCDSDEWLSDRLNEHCAHCTYIMTQSILVEMYKTVLSKIKYIFGT
jgi:hypothetical protein